MEFTWSEEEEAFRGRVRAFLQEYWVNRPNKEEGDEPFEGDSRFDQKLAEGGWLTMGWPIEYGGRGASRVEQMIFAEEAARVGAPTAGFGPRMTGPTLMLHGTEAQRARHLKGIAEASVVWAQGFSEPGAGSDLASLQTRAARDGDEYVVSGQKIWTSGAHRANWLMLLVRTDPEAPKHRGISFLLVDLKTPGITIRPLINMANQHHFNEVFFDEARVPVENRVGDENRGWYVATTTLDFERSGVHRAASIEKMLKPVLEFARQTHDYGRLGDLPGRRAALADAVISLEVGRLFGYRVGSMQARGLVPNYEASIVKLFNEELRQRFAQRTINALGLYGNLLKGKWAPIEGRAPMDYMGTIPSTIAGGSSEIQRNIIATRGLGLPRG